MPSPVPLSIKLTVLTVIMSEHIVSFMMPTIVVYMVERLGHYNSAQVSDFQSVSYWVGLLEGANRLFALFGGIIWGAISDRIGRKASLMYIITGIGLSSLGVGLSTSLYSILCWRVLAGFLAGTIPITKALMRDLSDDSNISVLYSYFGTGYGAASIIGPLVGGLLSSPQEPSSVLFSNSIISTFPYLYPFLIHFLFTLLALVLISKYIPSKNQNQNQGQGQGSGSSKYSFLHEKDFLLSSFIFVLIAVVQFSYRALITLWLRLDAKAGGIGWDSEVNPGIMNSLSGFIVMFAPLLLTDTLQQKFGLRKACSFVALALILPLMLVSLASALDGIAMWAYLVFMNGSAVALTTIMVSVVSIAVSNSVLHSVAGTAIGITQAVVAFSRAIGNGGTAFLFGLLQNEGFDFPFDFHLLFVVNVLVLVAVVALFWAGLDERIEKRKKAEVNVEMPLLSKG